MPCVEPTKENMRNGADFVRMFSSHDWNIAFLDFLEGRGMIVRFQCSKCNRELTSLSAKPLPGQRYGEEQATATADLV
ncbi:MAG TPA: hypothetical protein VFF30_12455 [Nitrososphaerales archaeon]|nr:hypothetical protein [Nitrososphaerales archaeon]